MGISTISSARVISIINIDSKRIIIFWHKIVIKVYEDLESFRGAKK
jgi:hypothetical protein